MLKVHYPELRLPKLNKGLEAITNNIINPKPHISLWETATISVIVAN